MSNYIANKTYTSNAFLDYLLYYCKILSFSSIIKDEELADQSETSESLMAGDIYISCVENNAIFELFNYTKAQLISVGITDPQLIIRCMNDRNNIPVKYREEITEIARKDYIDNYVEYNPYYRMICGLPPIHDYGIPIRDYEYKLFPDGTNPWNVTYIHELSHDAIKYLEQKGVIDEIRNDYPDDRYLDYITCGITPYVARKADMYSLLYTPEIEDNVIREKYIRKYNENRLFTIATYYSEGLKLTSKYYSSFIGMMINLMTITDILAELQEHVVKKDLLDKRCIQFIFEMYGIPYYNSIPIKYQYRMCKNINSLIRYKSCAQGMLNLIDLFGAENIEVFKYFILRDRNIDKWGDIVYKQIDTTIIKENKVNKDEYEKLIKHYESSTNGSFNVGDVIDVPYPIADYLEGGNLLIVWGDGIKLEKDIDYSINIEGQVVLNKSLSNIRFDFYYNSVSGGIIDKEHGLHIISDDVDIINTRTFSIKPPYPSYIKDGNDIIVSLGGAILGKDQYKVNEYNSTITLDDSFDLTTVYRGINSVEGRRIVVLYLFGDNIITKYQREAIVATSDNQTTFSIPEPFPNYIENDNAFFITYKNTFIQNNRYTINKANRTITFTDITVPLGVQVLFYFVYAEASVYQEVEIQRKDVELTVTEDYQTVFSLLDEDGNSLYPFTDPPYLTTPYKVYVRVRNYSRMLDQDYYDVYSKSLILRDTTLCLRKGEKITVSFVYGPHVSKESLEVVKNSVSSTENYQSVFDITIPTEGYFSHYNGAVIIDVYGNYLEPSDYTIDEENSKLTITNLNKRPAANEKINFTYIRNVVSENNIIVEQQYPDMELYYEGKPRFNITIPFANYFDTKQTVLVFHNSVLVNPRKVEHHTEQLVGSTLHFLTIDEDLSEYQSTDSVVVMFVYNGLYTEKLKENIEEQAVECNIEDIIDDDLVVSIPFPFSKYLENGWYLYITDEDDNIVYRSENDDDGEYGSDYPCEIINNSLTFIDTSVIPEYEKLIFHFIYFNSPSYITTESEEDYEANYTLKFVGVPLTQEYHNREIMQKINVSPYDAITLEDQFWDGVGYNIDKNELHNSIKAQILRKKFNYERTKYFGINYVINISEMAFRISYFYNMLYDKYFIEDNLNVRVPSIAPYKDFNIAHLFCYMTSLAYLFSGVEDYIINQFSTALLIKGFNFGADLDTLKKWLIKQFRYVEDFPVWKFITTKEQLYGDSDTTKEYVDNHVLNNTDPVEFDDLSIDGETITDGNQQIKDMDAFIDIYRNNRDIYDLIVKNIYQSQDYDIYSIWKKMYESLMLIDFNDAYYRVTLTAEGISEVGYGPADEHVPGEEIVARTFKELLYYKDRELYSDIKYIMSFNDPIQRNDLIIERISDIIYILEDWMDTDEFRNIYDTFPGVSGDSLVNYLFTIINFFKSYKVVLRAKGDYIVFTADDPLLNTIKIIDVKDTHADLEKHEYFDIEEYLDTGIYQYKDDRVFVKDKMSFDISVTDGIDNRYSDVKVKYPDYPYKFTATSKIRVKRTTNQYITIFTSNGESFTTNVNSGWISAVKPDATGIIGMITYFNPFINDSDSSHPFMKLKVLDESLDLDSTEQYIVLDHGFPPELLSKFKTQVDQSGTPTDHRHVLIRELDPESDYIEFEVPYGTEFYVYITPAIGWHAGVLNIRYGKIFDDDMIVEATDATTIIRELNIHQSDHQTIVLFNAGGTEITEESTLVPYGSSFFYRIDVDEGFNPGEIQIVPESAAVGSTINVTTTTDVSATAATYKTFRIKIEAPAHENIALSLNGGTVFVEAGTSRELTGIRYWTEYSIAVYSFEQYTAGELNIPATGQFTSVIQKEEGYIYITTTEPQLNKYTITVRQSPHQRITISYDGSTYSDDGSFIVTINTHIMCSIVSDDGYIAGVLNITDRIVNEDLTVYASEAVEAEQLLISIDPKENQTITVVCNGESYTEDVYVPFGSAYSSYITPSSGFTTRATIINSRSDELRNNVVVYASEDAIPNINTITLINPDPAHQILRIYVNEDQSEENIKTSTFTLPSGNYIRAEVESLDPKYIAGEVNVSEIMLVTSDIVITATAPTPIEE